MPRGWGTGDDFLQLTALVRTSAALAQPQQAVAHQERAMPAGGQPAGANQERRGEELSFASQPWASFARMITHRPSYTPRVTLPSPLPALRLNTNVKGVTSPPMLKASSTAHAVCCIPGGKARPRGCSVVKRKEPARPRGACSAPKRAGFGLKLHPPYSRTPGSTARSKPRFQT